ncbi:MAG: HAD family phosphatase [Muribaculaceae bacterium]|nr:HAD family phosphatase [Muribaculaceae bacterium]
MNAKKRCGALFDLDGVLIDTESTYSLFWSSIDEMYPTGIEDFAAAIKGTTLTEILGHFPTDDIRADVKRRIHDFEATMVYDIMPGVMELLQSLREEGFPIAIYTSSDNVKMAHLRAQHPQLLDAVDVIITGSDVSNSKPHPEGYINAAKALGCRPEDCFVFEDSIQGLEAGRCSGATVIGLATTLPAERLHGKARVILDGLTGFTAKNLLELVSTL